MPQVYAEPLLQRYLAPRGTLAYCFSWVYIITLLVVTYLVTYWTGAMWAKETIYVEQPKVDFRREFIIYAHGDTEDSAFAYTTWSKYNEWLGNTLWIPEARVHAVDPDRDGKAESWVVNLKFPLPSSSTVTNIQGFFFFDYILQDKVWASFESMASFDLSFSTPTAYVYVDGELSVHQKLPFPAYQQLNLYESTSIVNTSNPLYQDLLPRTILGKYLQRTYTTTMTNVYTTSQPSTVASENFEMELVIRIPHEQVRYVPPVMESFKLAWLQYLAVFLVLSLVFGWFKALIYKEQVLESRVVSDAVPKGKHHEY